MDPEIANDKQLRKDFDYDVAGDLKAEEGGVDVDDEYSELSGVVGMFSISWGLFEAGC